MDEEHDHESLWESFHQADLLKRRGKILIMTKTVHLNLLYQSLVTGVNQFFPARTENFLQLMKAFEEICEKQGKE